MGKVGVGYCRVGYCRGITKSTLLPTSLNLHSLVSDIMQYTNSFPKFLTITARWLAANKMQDRAKVTTEPTVYYLKLSEQLAYILAAAETDPLVETGKLDRMAKVHS